MKLNCLTLPTPPSPSTGWALATTREATLGARVCQSITAARNRRGAATGDAISRVQLLAEAIAPSGDRPSKNDQLAVQLRERGRAAAGFKLLLEFVAGGSGDLRGL